MSELSGLELRKAVAKLIGFEHKLLGDLGFWYRAGHVYGLLDLPPYELSLDACFKDVVPWILRNDVLIEFRMITPDKMKVFITRLKPFIELAARGYGTPAEAICRAVLKLEVKSEA